MSISYTQKVARTCLACISMRVLISELKLNCVQSAQQQQVLVYEVQCNDLHGLVTLPHHLI